MKVVIFGANGKTGKLLVEQALAKGIQVIAYIRKADSLKTEHPNLKIEVGNLTESLRIRDCISGVDACISALGGGSLQHHATEVIKGIDNIVRMMEQEKVPRFIYLSSIGTGESKYFIPHPVRFYLTKILLRVPFEDHNTNEKRIISSSLNWTIVRPGGLTDGPLTKDLKHGTEKFKIKGNSSISRANVATFMLQQLYEDTYSKKAVWLLE